MVRVVVEGFVVRKGDGELRNKDASLRFNHIQVSKQKSPFQALIVVIWLCLFDVFTNSAFGDSSVCLWFYKELVRVVIYCDGNPGPSHDDNPSFPKNTSSGLAFVQNYTSKLWIFGVFYFTGTQRERDMRGAFRNLQMSRMPRWNADLHHFWMQPRVSTNHCLGVLDQRRTDGWWLWVISNTKVGANTGCRPFGSKLDFLKNLLKASTGLGPRVVLRLLFQYV